MAFDPPLDQLRLSLDRTRKLRARRSEFFDAELFSDPAWDILLLLAEEPRNSGISAVQVAASLGQAASVTERWLKILEGKRQVEQVEAGRYRLSEPALAALAKVFDGFCKSTVAA